jgi:hypothetical protein
MAGLDQVKHIVVLMLENRSFDHLCGFLKRRIPALDGLTGAESIPRDPAAGPGDPVQVSDDAPPVTDVDPGHALGDVSQQMYGRPEPEFPGNGANDGFVANYRRYTGSDEGADDIMRCFAPESLPVLTTLAEEFTICDRWFASLPGPTWPNRVFVHAGTSAGHTDNGFRLYDVPTIFQRLEQARHRWCVYYHDVPQALVFPHVVPHYLNILQLLAHASALEAARARGKRGAGAGTRTVGESVAYLAGATPVAPRPGAARRPKPRAKKATAKVTAARSTASRPAKPARKRTRPRAARSKRATRRARR